MKSVLKRIDGWISNIILAASIVFLALVAFSAWKAHVDGTDLFVLGYRPIYVLTGSMEPTMDVNSLCMTKQLTDEDGIDIGDIITFRVYDETLDRNVVITHRVKEISNDGIITTQGDNNDAPDNYVLTRENVLSKVVGIWNGFAIIVAMTQSKYFVWFAGSICVGAILIILSVKMFKSSESASDMDYIEEIEDDEADDEDVT